MANAEVCQRHEVAGAAAAGTLSSDDVEERQPMLWASEAVARSARRWASLAAGACLLGGGAAWRGWQGPSGSTLRSSADGQAPLVVLEQQGEWDARWGFNCANGQGADALWAGAEGEIDGRIDFTLEECQRECKSRMPDCQGFITINDENRPDLAHRCWLRTNIQPENCFQGTPYNLWIWTGPANTPSPPQHPEKEQTTAAPAATTARATPAPPAPKPTVASKGSSSDEDGSDEGGSAAAAEAEAGSSGDEDGSDEGGSAAAAEAEAGSSAGAEAKALWVLSEPNQFCKNRNLVDSVSSQAECEDLCVADDECVGIAYTHAEGLTKYCYLCHDDNLIASANDFGFYRKVESARDDEVEAAEEAAHEAAKPGSRPEHAASHKGKAHEAGSKHVKRAEQQKPGEKADAEGNQDDEDAKKHASEEAKPAREEEDSEFHVFVTREDSEQEEEEEEEEEKEQEEEEEEKRVVAAKKKNKKQKNDEKTRSKVEDVEKKLEEEMDPEDVAVR